MKFSQGSGKSILWMVFSVVASNLGMVIHLNKKCRDASAMVWEMEEFSLKVGFGEIDLTQRRHTKSMVYFGFNGRFGLTVNAAVLIVPQCMSARRDALNHDKLPLYLFKM